MLKEVLFIGVTSLLIACGNQNTATVDNAQNQPADTVLNESLTPIDPLLKELFGMEHPLPFVQDSIVIEPHYDESHYLLRDQVDYLSAPLTNELVVVGSAAALDDFFGLDSLHREDEMAVWETADGFFVLHSYALPIRAVKVDDSTTVLFWTLQYSGPPGISPNASGGILYASVLQNNCVTDCMAVGEETYSVDAPYWVEVVTCIVLSTDGYRSEQTIREGGEFDEAYNQEITETKSLFTLTIEHGKWHAEEAVVNQ